LTVNIINKNGKKTAYLVMMQSLPDGGSFMRLRELVRIIEIPKQSYRIAISWFRVPKKSEPGSGYVFLSPTDGKRDLVVTYPAIDYGEKLAMKDLSFKLTRDK